MKRDKFHGVVLCGEMSAIPLEQLTTLVDTVCVHKSALNSVLQAVPSCIVNSVSTLHALILNRL